MMHLLISLNASGVFFNVSIFISRPHSPLHQPT
jgi:hypothetical protein